jgi:hypothetical protein
MALVVTNTFTSAEFCLMVHEVSDRLLTLFPAVFRLSQDLLQHFKLVALSERLIVFVTPLKDFLDENRIASNHLDASQHYAGGVVVIRGYRQGQSSSACLPASARERRRSSTQHTETTLATHPEEPGEQVRMMGAIVRVG